MNKAWPIMSLAEVLTERQEVPSTEALANGDIRIVAKIGFNDGKIQLRNGSETKTGMILVRPGDLLISGINAAKGAIAIYGEENTEPIAATIHYGAYIPDKGRVNEKYLWWLLRSGTFRDLLYTYVPGGIKTELKAKRLLPIPVPLPSIVEQRRIVAKIDELAAKIHEAYTICQEALKETEALTGVFLKSAFDSRLATGAWPSRLLPEIAKVARGKFGHRPRNEPRFYGGNIPFIQIGDISNAKRYIRSYSQTLNKQGLAISRLFPVGTVVIAITGATIGVTGILTFDSCFPDSIVGIQAKPEFATPEFIYFAVEYAKNAALAEATQTTQPNINLSNLERLKVPVPPISEQYRMVAQLSTLQEEVDALRHLQTETSDKLDALLPSILDKAFKGEF